MKGVRQAIELHEKKRPALPTAIGATRARSLRQLVCAGSSRQEHPPTKRADVGWTPTRRTFNFLATQRCNAE